MTMHVLSQMIHSDARLSLESRYSRPSIQLIEDSSSDSRVEIAGLPDNAIVIKIDAFSDPGHFLNNEKGECRRADFAIVAEVGSKRRILIIELKRTNAQSNHLTQQFKGARCVMAYCEEVARQFYDCKDFLNGFEYRYVSFCRTNIRKTRTRIKQNSNNHNKPHRFLKISHPNRVEYNHLVGA